MIVLAEGAQLGSPACPLALWAVACVVRERRELGLFPERREAAWLARGPALPQHQPQTSSTARGGRRQSVAASAEVLAPQKERTCPLSLPCSAGRDCGNPGDSEHFSQRGRRAATVGPFEDWRKQGSEGPTGWAGPGNLQPPPPCPRHRSSPVILLAHTQDTDLA